MRLLLLAALTFLLGACATGRGAGARLPEHEVLAAEQSWYTALAAKDVAALERLLAQEFVLNGGSPELESREQYLRTARMSERVLEPSVWVHRDGRWQAVNSHVSVVSP